MTTSPLKYHVQFGGSPGSNKRPLSAFDARNVLLNNLCHDADEYGQEIVNWVGTKTTLAVGTDGYLFNIVDPPVNSVYQITQFPCPLRIRADGSSYHVRIRIAGASLSPGNDVKFYAALGLPGLAAYASSLLDGTPGLFGTLTPTAHGDAVFLTAATNSATPVWLTGTSQGTNGWSDMIRLTADQVADQLSRHATETETGDRETVQYLDTSLVIFSISAVDSVPGALYGVKACEWIGPNP